MSDWEVTVSNTQWFGVAANGTEIVGIAAGRKSEEQALLLAEKIDADTHFAVQATNKTEARIVAGERLNAYGIEPTDEEMAEVAEMKRVLDDPEAIAKALEPKAPRSAPKTGTWYGCATDEAGDTMVTEEAYSTPDLARAGAVALLPNSPKSVIAVQGKSRDAALDVYDALSESDRASMEGASIAAAASERGSLLEVRTEPVRSQQYLVSSSGMLHSSPECRFIKDKVVAATIEGRPGAIDDVMAGKTVVADDEKKRVVAYCVYCSAAKPEQVAVSA